MQGKFQELLRAFFSHRKVLIFSVIVTAVFVFIPDIAEAFVHTKIQAVLIDLPLLLIEKVLSVIANLNGYIFSGVAVAMTAVIKYFMSMTVTPGALNTPSFVSETWNMVRQLTNIFFILILVFIGLATILRLASYQMKQTLPLLLIMALLVNFSGVFVGFIVDISNLVTNYFLDQAKNFTDLGTLKKDFFTGGDATESIGKIAKHISAIIYYLVATLIFLILMFVFMIRTWFLWIIVILSPLAFASYILPATRSKIWDQWWKQLIQWSFFAIPVSFTLWLARASLSISGDPNIGSAPSNAGFLSEFMAPFTALFILYIGITISQQMAPAAANTMANLGKGLAGKAGLAAGSAAWRFRGAGRFKLKKSFGETIEARGLQLRQFGETMGMSPTERAKKKKDKSAELQLARDEAHTLGTVPDHLRSAEDSERLEKLEGEGGEIENLEGEEKLLSSEKGGKRLGAQAFLARWAGRGIELPASEIQRRTASKDQREIKEGKSEGAGQDSKDLARQINQELAKGALKNQNRIIGLLNAMVDNGDSDDLQEYLRRGLLSSNRIGEAFVAARRGGPPTYRPLMKAMAGNMISNPEQFGANFATKKVEGTDEMQRKANGIVPVFSDSDVQKMVDEIPDKLKSAEIIAGILGDTLNKGKVGGKEFMDGGGKDLIKWLTDVRGGDLVGSVIRSPDTKEGRAGVIEAYQAMDLQWLHDKGADGIITYLASTAAQGAGVVSPLSSDETREVIKLMSDADRGIAGTVEEMAENTSRIKVLTDIWKGLAPSSRTTPGDATGGTPPSGTSREGEGYRGGIG